MAEVVQPQLQILKQWNDDFRWEMRIRVAFGCGARAFAPFFSSGASSAAPLQSTGDCPTMWVSVRSATLTTRLEGAALTDNTACRPVRKRLTRVQGRFDRRTGDEHFGGGPGRRPAGLPPVASSDVRAAQRVPFHDHTSRRLAPATDLIVAEMLLPCTA